MGVKLDNPDEWNKLMAEKLMIIGPSKQANVLLILVDTPDQSYRHALEKAWIGGKKNDIIVLVGVVEKNIAWADVITLGGNSGNELMSVLMRDELVDLGSIEDHVKVIETVGGIVLSHFDRKPMADYEYLADEIEPPTWVIILAIILAFLGSAGLTWLFHTKDLFRR